MISSLLVRVRNVMETHYGILLTFHFILYVITNIHMYKLQSENHIGAQNISRTSYPTNQVFILLSLAYFIMEIQLLQEMKRMIDAGAVMVRFSSFIFIGIALLLRRWNLLHPMSILVSISLELSKLIVSFVGGRWHHDGTTGRAYFLIHAGLIATFIFSVGYPFLPSNPLMNQENNNTSNDRFNKKRKSLHKTTLMRIGIYCGLFLPALILHFTSTLKQLLQTFMGVKSHTECSRIFLQFEVLGCSSLMWGTIVTIILNHNFRDGGAEVWKRFAVASIVFGFLICYLMPSFLSLTICDSSTTNSTKHFVQSLSNNQSTENYQISGIFGALVTALVLSKFFIQKLILKGKGKRSLLSFQKKFGLFAFCFTLVFRKHIIGIYPFIYISSCALFAFAINYGGFVRDGEYSCLFLGLLTSYIVGYTMNNSRYKDFSFILILYGMNCLFLSIMSRFLRKRKITEKKDFTNMSILSFWVSTITFVLNEFGVASIGVSHEYSYIMGYPVSKPSFDFELVINFRLKSLKQSQLGVHNNPGIAFICVVVC